MLRDRKGNAAVEVALIWHLAIVRSSTAEDCVGVRVGALGSLSVLSDKELAALADHTPALSNGLQRANLKGSGVEARLSLRLSYTTRIA